MQPPFTPKRKRKLEAVANAEFCAKRVRQSHTARSNETQRLLERTRAEITTVIVTKVRAVGQVEELYERGDVVVFMNPKVLRDSRIELEERLAAQIIERRKLATAGAQTIPKSD